MPTLHKLMAPLFGAALLLAATPVLSGGFYSGNELLKFCKGPHPHEAGADVGAYNVCVMYLAGIADAEDAWVAWGYKAKHFCIPEGTTTEQLRQVFLRWMDQSPELWHLTAARLATLAFQEAWWCAD